MLLGPAAALDDSCVRFTLRFSVLFDLIFSFGINPIVSLLNSMDTPIQVRFLSPEQNTQR